MSKVNIIERFSIKKVKLNYIVVKATIIAELINQKYKKKLYITKSLM
jgi:hypothetical protein